MVLYIDTSDREKITLKLDNKKFETMAKDRTSQKLLPFIDEVLGKNKMTPKDISEIQVNTGPGSYTGLRIGVAIANTLGWELGIPVNGKDIEKGETVEINY